jgi:FkbM family methyltransferase
LGIVSQAFRCGPTLDYDDSDWYESRVSEIGHINPSLEFWLKDNASNYNNAIVVGAGFGLSSKLLIDAGADVTSLEPVTSRYDLLETNVPTGTNLNKGAGALPGTELVYYNSDNKSGAVIDKEVGLQSQQVEVITLDSLGLSPDLIIVYANGKEMEVLDGASQTITDNPSCKIIIRWVPDKFEDINDAYNKLTAFGKTIHIIHWEEDGDEISLKTQLDGVKPNDNLKAVTTADLLLE